MAPLALLQLRGWPLFLFTFLLFVQVYSAGANTTTISTTGWRKPNVTLSNAARIGTAATALEKAIDNLPTTEQYDGQTYEFVATLFAEMADFDLITGQTVYQDTLNSLFAQTLGNRPLFSDQYLILDCESFVSSYNRCTRLNRTYGYAAIRAYAAYRNPVFLQYANQSWTLGNEYTIPNPVTTPVVKDFALSSNCQGATMAGGTFYTNSTSDPSVTAMSTGYFALLSALLAEATSAPSYLASGVQSAQFIHSHMYNANNLVSETISAAQNDSCKITNSVAASFNQGLFIEGLATLQSISPSGDTQSLLESLITSCLTNSDFQTLSGISAQGRSENGDNILIRALSSAYTRNVTSPGLREVLHDYLSVQYNAVVDLATVGGSDIYSIQWSVQSSLTSNFSMKGQTNALGVLLSGISLDDNNASITTNSSSSASASASASATQFSSGSHGLAAGTIAGIVVAVVFILVAGLTILILHWRQRSRLSAVRPLSVPTFPAPASQSTVPAFVNASLMASSTMMLTEEIPYMPRSVVRKPVPYSNSLLDIVSPTSAGIGGSARVTYVSSAVAATSSSTSPVSHGPWRMDEKTPRMVEEGLEAPPPEYDSR
ncbi:hypothetical protein FB45DRAFT_217545 [Roridomyces roridus]|uniref:Glycoside hydrolase family 76 protein n=1 Tax=Roridomyces roridus TaxID=1738132 RepID=A0AAD7BEH7_9AGAR|nr:hypothetical protein FB45DRAFT_217545 [Roridomyces roridus]